MQLMLEQDGTYQDLCYDDDGNDENNNGNDDASGTSCSEQSIVLVRFQLVGHLVGAFFAPFLGLLADWWGAVFILKTVTAFCVGGISLCMVASATQVHWLYYIAFSLFGLLLYGTSLMTVETGLVMDTAKQQRMVISLLNTLIDAGTFAFFFLHLIQTSTQASFVLVLGVYLGLAVLSFGGAAVFWKQTIRLMEHDQQEQQHQKEQHLQLQQELQQEQEQACQDYRPDETRINISMEVDSIKDSTEKSTGKPYIETEVVTEELSAQERQAILILNNPSNSNHTKRFSNNNNNNSNHSTNTKSHPIDEASQTPTSFSSDSNKEYLLIRNRTPRKQLSSTQFVLLTIFFVIQLGRNTFVMATAREWLRSLGDDQYQHKYVLLFTALSAVSVVGLPIFVWIITDSRLGYHGAFQCINVLGIIHGVIQLSTDNLNVQVIGFCVFSFYRCFLFSTCFSFLPVFLSGATVGRGAGILNFAASFFSLSNLGLVYLGIEVYDNDFFVPNLILTCAMIPCIGIAWWMGRCIQQEQKALLLIDTTTNTTTLTTTTTTLHAQESAEEPCRNSSHKT